MGRGWQEVGDLGRRRQGTVKVWEEGGVGGGGHGRILFPLPGLEALHGFAPAV